MIETNSSHTIRQKKHLPPRPRHAAVYSALPMTRDAQPASRRALALRVTAAWLALILLFFLGGGPAYYYCGARLYASVAQASDGPVQDPWIERFYRPAYALALKFSDRSPLIRSYVTYLQWCQSRGVDEAKKYPRQKYPVSEPVVAH
jgi:hypothetical protein